MQKAMAQERLEQRGTGQNPTGSPVGHNKWALDVRALVGYSNVGAADTVDSFSLLTNAVTAAGHLAKSGDRIRFNDGPLAALEFSVHGVTTDEIILAEEPPEVPAPGNAFVILRPTSLSVSSTGGLSNALSFTRDGASQVVTEDTLNPANNVPLPVKLTGVTGEVIINAGDLQVQNSHTGANPDSIQIGDGTEVMQVNASGEAQVSDDAARTSLASLDSKVTAVNTADVAVTSTVLPPGAASETTLAALNAKVTAVDTGAVTVASSALPTGAATSAKQDEQKQLLEMRVLDVNQVSYSITALPGFSSAPLTLFSSISGTAREIQVWDTSGVSCLLLEGLHPATTAIGAFGPGAADTIKVNLPPGSRISVKRIDSPVSVNVGDITINVVGY